MDYQNPIHHRDYVVTAHAEEVNPGDWRGWFVAEKDGETALETKNFSSFPSKEEAERQALALARAVIDLGLVA